MRKLVFILFLTVTGLSAVSADTVFDFLDWEQVECSIDPKTTRPNTRSVFSVPRLYQSEQYLFLQYSSNRITNAHVSILNAQGEIMKDGIIQLGNDCDNLFYIGDIADGMYTVEIETDDFFMVGTIEI